MNAIPPGKSFFCVGTGLGDIILHPDRAPYTDLAQQDGVILFSGAAPQQGQNFRLNAGSLIYRNQMSTLGAWEIAPQVGTAGMLQMRGDDNNLPWTASRWYSGESVAWQGFRGIQLAGLPFWREPCGEDGGSTWEELCSSSVQEYPVAHSQDCGLVKSRSLIEIPASLAAAFNLQLAPGAYQVSMTRENDDQCPYKLREPWFQGQGRHPAFNVRLNTNGGSLDMCDLGQAQEDPPGCTDITGQTCDYRIAADFFPNYHGIYTYRQLELDGGRLTVDFERSNTWPRYLRSDDHTGGGTMVPDKVEDRYGNKVIFDRVPAYGWETDYKIPKHNGHPEMAHR